MRRLSRAGFKKDFVYPAILPEWWEDACAQDAKLLPDIEVRVARFLGVPLAAVRQPEGELSPPAYPKAQLRRVRDIDRDRLAAALHAAIRIAAAVVRNLGKEVPPPALPPADGAVWRDQITRDDKAVTFDSVLADLWKRGIPVVPLDLLPAPNFQGAACIVEGRPVIVLGHRHEELGRAAFIVAHEAGHIAAGDCTPDQPVVDEDDEVVDDADIERRADLYATRVLVGEDSVPVVDGATFKELATRAAELEEATGADASLTIAAWAARTRDYKSATMAIKALYRATGARRQLREYFERHVDIDSASESDRDLLRCVHGEPSRHAVAD